MSEHNPHQDFARQLTLRDYVGATYALAAVEIGEEFRNLACRLVLATREPPASWNSRSGIDSLHVFRGWIPQARVSQTIAALRVGQLTLDSVELKLRRISDGTPYTWGTQEYFAYVKERIGWPGLGLRGWGEPQDFVAGYSEHARLSRSLPGMRPRPFGDWRKLGQFLGGSASPIELGDSTQAFVEFFAPTYARLVGVELLGADNRTAAVEFDSLLDAAGGDLRLLLDHDVDADPLEWTLQHATKVGDHRWRLEFPRPDRPEPSDLRLLVRGQTIDSIEVPGNISILRDRMDAAASRFTSAPRKPVESALDRGGPPLGPTVRVALSELHPRVYGATAPMVETGKYNQAIMAALTIVEDEVRTVAGLGPESIGVTLMTQALGRQPISIRVAHHAAEQEAAHQLFRGVIGLLKNPRSHRVLPEPSESEALEMLALASLLLRLVDGRVAGQPVAASEDS